MQSRFQTQIEQELKKLNFKKNKLIIKKCLV